MISLYRGVSSYLFSSVVYLSSSSVYFICHLLTADPVLLIGLPSTALRPSPIGCVISPDQSQLIMT